ncbi:MAG: hypothetical protein K1X53_03950 [Candidatus Sumerlaeaceae bacterium]|nr:hypothetical protein [Candidatus Sumerlaeaceae bacterium]
MELRKEEIEALWRDDRNYRWGLIYYCKADPRVVVPKRIKWMGWTMNCAHPVAALVYLLGYIVLLLLPVLAAIALQAGPTAVVWALVIDIILVCVLSAYLASPERYAD